MICKKSVLNLYKKVGETPLECIKRFQSDHPEYQGEKMTYAGRLDPLASGVLLVLVGKECKQKEKYLGLDKEYEVDVLFGFATDTYDLLGKVTNVCHSCEGRNPCSIKFVMDPCLRRDDTIKILLQSFVGKFSQKYPMYSSKNIKGILKARKNGGLTLKRNGVTGKGESLVFSDIEDGIIEKNVEIKSIELLGERIISKNDLEKYIIDSVNLVKGDFRQKEILKKWRSVLDGTIRANKGYIKDCKHGVIPAEAGIQNTFNLDSCLRRNDNTNQFLVISIRVNCTSGTYMRSLANSIGEKVGIPALALNIKRTRIYENKSNE